MKVIRKFLVCAVMAVSVMTMSSLAAYAADEKNETYVTAAHLNTYHYPGCRAVILIKPENLITFHSKKEAKTGGFLPCKKCKS